MWVHPFAYLVYSFADSTSYSATKVGAVVSGQTSVKAPERDAFEKYLPDDVHIVSCHSLHGPTVTTKGQPLVQFEILNRKDAVGSYTRPDTYQAPCI